MDQPIVAAIMLVNGRAEMVQRALRSFRAQDYPNKRLMIYDTGDPSVFPQVRTDFQREEHYAHDRGSQDTIGTLRNKAITCISADIIMHFDSDDWSHPRRMTEQVALLQESGAQCVGYREMLFWKTTGEMRFDPTFGSEGFGSVTETEDAIEIETGQLEACGEAWLYSSTVKDYCLGTSLCYWRSAWVSNPFPDTPKRAAVGFAAGEGEDLLWQRKVKCVTTSSVPFDSKWGKYGVRIEQPRMIASVHGGNTLSRITPGMQEWTRVNAWDEYCRKEMAL